MAPSQAFYHEMGEDGKPDTESLVLEHVTVGSRALNYLDSTNSRQAQDNGGGVDVMVRSHLEIHDTLLTSIGQLRRKWTGQRRSYEVCTHVRHVG